MSTISLLGASKKTSKAISRINRNSKLFKVILQAVQEKKAEEIVSLDLRKIPEAVADFFIICQASSTTQVRAIADNVEHRVKELCLETPYRHEGMNALQWVLVDYVNIVVHVFQPETRKFYRLEEMWSDAEQQEHS
ncbi:MAG: ribosome silencing factor [Chitinophagaceae bacterium]|nr:ribosome silencing factor [Chitinophagaceae bacterium]